MRKSLKSRHLATLVAIAIICSPACGSLVEQKQHLASNHGLHFSSTQTLVASRSYHYAATDASYMVIESNGDTSISPIMVSSASDSSALDLSRPQILTTEPGTEIQVIPEDGGCSAGDGCYAPLPDLNSSPDTPPSPTKTTEPSATTSALPAPENPGRGSGGSNLPPFEPSLPWPTTAAGNTDQPAESMPLPAPYSAATSSYETTSIEIPLVHVPEIPSPKIDLPDVPTNAPINAAASGAVSAVLATMNGMQQRISDKLAKLAAESSPLLSDGRAARKKQPVVQPSTLAPDGYPFKTAVDSPEGQRLAEVLLYKQYVNKNIRSDDERVEDKRKLVTAADAGLHQADNAFIRGARAEAEFLMNASIIALDIAISVGPLGWAKFGYEAITKKDFLSGHPLNSVSHGIAIAAFTVSMIAMAATAEIGLPVLAGAAGVELFSDMLKASTELEVGAGASAELAEISEAVKSAESTLDSAKIFGANTAKETEDFIKTAEGVLGKDIATAGQLGNLVESASTLARDVKFTETTAKRMEDAARHVPREVLSEAIKYGKKTPDPQGVIGAERYVIDMFKNGKKYTLEVIYRESDTTILHFLYK